MGAQQNLNEENVEELTLKLEAMKKENPALEYQFFEQTEESPGDDKSFNQDILDRLISIERQLKLIFDGHVLINGVFRKL